MNDFLRRVMERRLEEQMQAVRYEVRPVIVCKRCRKEYQAKANSHPDYCFNCRHTIRRARLPLTESVRTN